MKIKNALTAALAAMAMLTAGCIGGGNSANKMDTPKEGLAELQVSAAASLTDAMKELGGMYEKEHGNTKLVFNFGSSGALQQAIENGGAADVFISAAQKQMNALDEKKLLADGTRADLLINEVVLITAKDSKLNLPDFKAVLDPAVAHRPRRAEGSTRRTVQRGGLYEARHPRSGEGARRLRLRCPAGTCMG